nr:SH3 domain-containing protein C23A1.17-like [Aegilops tauschii subsp. strangulata]
MASTGPFPPPPYGASATYGASRVAPPARPDVPHGSAPMPQLSYVAAPPPALSGQFVVAPPPVPTLPVDPLLLRGAFDALVYGAPGYWWGSSAGPPSPAGQQPDGARHLQHLSAGQQVFPAGHPAYPAPQSQLGLLPIPSGEYPPPQPSGG